MTPILTQMLQDETKSVILNLKTVLTLLQKKQFTIKVVTIVKQSQNFSIVIKINCQNQNKPQSLREQKCLHQQTMGPKKLLQSFRAQSTQQHFVRYSYSSNMHAHKLFI